jgi:catechol 2,3-dioxygenase-like lactoylglutathione lyase family enzyme
MYGVLDHVTIRVADFEASKRFYATVLTPLGIGLNYEADTTARWGDFAISADGKPTAQNVHAAFGAKDNAAVDAFWQAGIEAGYRDNGAPGERAQYHAGYYGAFLLDPDGNNVEAVCHNRS